MTDVERGDEKELDAPVVATEASPLLVKDDRRAAARPLLLNDDSNNEEDESLSASSCSSGLSLGSYDDHERNNGGGDDDDALSFVSTRSVSSVMSEAWDSYNAALDQRPLLVKSLTAGILLGAGDICGQVVVAAGQHQWNNHTLDNNDVVAASSSLDVARTLRFSIMGFILQAPLTHYYYIWLDGTWPPTRKPFTTFRFYGKLAIDQLVQAPIFLLLVFWFLGILQGQTCKEIARQLREQYVDTLLANWKLWLPAQVVNIAFCPPQLRVLFLNVVFFFWSILLSVILHNTNDNDDAS